MRIELTTSRPAREETWTVLADEDAGLGEAIEELIGAYRAAQRYERGESRFGVKPLDIRFTF